VSKTVVVRGRTWSLDATVFDTYVAEGSSSNVPTNHTDWSIRSQIRTRLGNELVANVNVTFPVPTSGTVAVRHSRAFTRAIAPGVYRWDVVATDPSGNDHVYIPEEPIEFRNDPTDPESDVYDFIPVTDAVLHTHPLSQITGTNDITAINVTSGDELEIVKGGVTYYTPLFRRP
jgi:hypothetical protein